MARFHLKGRPVEFDGDGGMPLLWHLRDNAGPDRHEVTPGTASTRLCPGRW